MTRIRKLLSQCGPGVISGAANDDPSCIVTYSIAGASFGYLTLWTSIFALPLIAAVQLLCARLGMVSGRGLAGAARTAWPAWIVVPLCALLAVANVVTLGADLGGMAEVTEMVTGISAAAWTVVYTLALGSLLFKLSYGQIERIFKWLTLVLFAYVFAGVLAKPDWGKVIEDSLVPRVEFSKQYLSTLVAIIGATVSPYFLFWQTSQEVENEMCLGRKTVSARRGASGDEFERANVDVMAGSTMSKLITYFITITTAATLFTHGKKEISTARDAAAALGPVGGTAGTWLFALGVIGTGLLAIPVLAGSCAYAWSEAFRWRASLTEKPKRAANFYIVLFLAMAVGLGLVWAGFRVIDMLFWASVLNGLLAPVSLLAVVLLTSNPSVMAEHTSNNLLRSLGWAGFGLSAVAAIAMLIGFAGT